MKIKFSMQMNEELKSYCEGEAKRIGISLSGFLNITAASWQQQQDAIHSAASIMEAIKNTQVDKLGK